MSEYMNKIRWGTIIIASLLVVNIAVIQVVLCSPFEGFFPPPQRPETPFLQYFIIAKAILALMNTSFLTILLVIYLRIYRNTGSQFTFGLIMFSLALLLYSISSNPIIHMFAGFRATGLGPFTMLPDLFTSIASMILLYLSRQ